MRYIQRLLSLAETVLAIPGSIFYLWLGKVLASDSRLYICNACSHWLRPCLVIDRKRAQIRYTGSCVPVIVVIYPVEYDHLHYVWNHLMNIHQMLMSCTKSMLYYLRAFYNTVGNIVFIWMTVFAFASAYLYADMFRYKLVHYHTVLLICMKNHKAEGRTETEFQFLSMAKGKAVYLSKRDEVTYADRADSRFVPSQWEPVLLCNDVSHWLGAGLESALCSAIDRKRVQTELTTGNILSSMTSCRMSIVSIPSDL